MTGAASVERHAGPGQCGRQGVVAGPDLVGLAGQGADRDEQQRREAAAMARAGPSQATGRRPAAEPCRPRR